MPRKKTTGRKDRIKCPIPDDLIPLFDEAAAIRRWLFKMRLQTSGFTHIKRYFKTGWLNEKDVLLGLKLILDRVELNIPHRVCPGCSRLLQCPRCGGKGWLTVTESYRCRQEILKRRTSARATSQTEKSSGSSSSPLTTKSASSTEPHDDSTSSTSELSGA